ncbi:glycosyltransferase family 4 protein [Burkholderiaceae bacterium DAT-1]|nr:glycosyltransferase family 4 protein [Burkholderiaceae bacterium DAT-1]
MFNVLIIQRRMTDYRVAFFEMLRTDLLTHGINLQVIYGQCNKNELQKHDSGALEFGTFIKNIYLFNSNVVIQPILKNIIDIKPDLIILTQENKLLLNYLLLFSPFKSKICFWGHGRDLQNQSTFKSILKYHLTRRTRWFFSYTKMSSEILISKNYPAQRITNVENAIDTKNILNQTQSLRQSDLENTKIRLGIESSNIGVFIGSLYQEKRLDFLFACADRIRKDIPEFHLIIIGNGPMASYIEEQCTNRQKWCTWVKEQHGIEKIKLIKISKLIINPGLVGLSILDSFATGTPLITTDCGLHSPEIAYLENGINGLITDNTEFAFCDAVTKLLNDDTKLLSMRNECLASAHRYTLENMVQNFSTGIRKALKHGL